MGPTFVKFVWYIKCRVCFDGITLLYWLNDEITCVCDPVSLDWKSPAMICIFQIGEWFIWCLFLLQNMFQVDWIHHLVEVGRNLQGSIRRLTYQLTQFLNGILLPEQDDCLVSADGASANFMFGQSLLAKTCLGEKNLTHGAWGSVFAIPLLIWYFFQKLCIAQQLDTFHFILYHI